MKHILLKFLATVALVLPVSGASKPPATFGGFTSGQQFSFRVTSKNSVSSVNGVVTNNAPVPTGIPNYSVGQSVAFTIGSKGELIASGFKMPYLSDAGTSNVYATMPSRKNPTPNSGLVFKNVSTKVPLGASLTFYLFKIKGLSVTANTVTYMLDP